MSYRRGSKTAAGAPVNFETICTPARRGWRFPSRPTGSKGSAAKNRRHTLSRMDQHRQRAASSGSESMRTVCTKSCRITGNSRSCSIRRVGKAREELTRDGRTNRTEMRGLPSRRAIGDCRKRSSSYSRRCLIGKLSLKTAFPSWIGVQIQEFQRRDRLHRRGRRSRRKKKAIILVSPPSGARSRSPGGRTKFATCTKTTSSWRRKPTASIRK